MAKEFIKATWHEMYLEMASNPNDHRLDKEFCEEVKIHISTLGSWKRLHRREIYDEVQKRRSQYINELRSNAWKALTEKMKKDVNAIKLAFQLTGDLVERSESRVEHMSRKDILDRANNILGELNAKKETWKKVEEAESGTTADQGNPSVGNGELGHGAGEDMPGSGTV